MKKATKAVIILSALCVLLLLIGVHLADSQSPVKQITVVKTDTTKKQVYDYFVKMSTNDVNQYLQLLRDYKAVLPYGASKTDAEKINLQKSIDAYIDKLIRTLKVDSVRIKK